MKLISVEVASGMEVTFSGLSAHYSQKYGNIFTKVCWCRAQPCLSDRVIKVARLCIAVLDQAGTQEITITGESPFYSSRAFSAGGQSKCWGDWTSEIKVTTCYNNPCLGQDRDRTVTPPRGGMETCWANTPLEQLERRYLNVLFRPIWKASLSLQREHL